MNRARLASLCDTIHAGKRISGEEALLLLTHADLLVLGQLAETGRQRFHKSDRATFLIDRNINYTNICVSQCRFCAFYRQASDPQAYCLTTDEIIAKVAEAARLGATQIMLQGGLHPELSIDYFEAILNEIKSRFSICVHSFSPPEIVHLAGVSGLTIRSVLERLRAAGLDSLPGGGAEILVDRVRQQVSPHKASTAQWLEVMEAAHALGLRTTATMMIGTVETNAERIEHLMRIRQLQDRTGGFRAFIPWTFVAGNTELGGAEPSALDYLRTLAISRIYLDNIINIQGSWVTQGREIGQMSLFFGANDLGSIMLEENVVRAAGASNRITEAEMVGLIRRAGKSPAQRDTAYRILKTYP